MDDPISQTIADYYNALMQHRKLVLPNPSTIPQEPTMNNEEISKLSEESKREIIRGAIRLCKWIGHFRPGTGRFAEHTVQELKDLIERHTGKEIEEYT